MIEAKVDMYRFEYELNNIKNKEKLSNATLFYGSSTFAIWKDIEKLFAPFNAINAGFGGSTSHEALFHYQTVAKPFAPKTVVWYFGDNEPVCGYTVEETIRLFSQTWQCFLKDFPNVKIISVLTKTSPERDQYADFVQKLNEWQTEYSKQHSWLTVVETADICKKNGEYILENYLPDQLHFGDKGYKILYNKLIGVLK